MNLTRRVSPARVEKPSPDRLASSKEVQSFMTVTSLCLMELKEEFTTRENRERKKHSQRMRGITTLVGYDDRTESQEEKASGKT